MNIKKTKELIQHILKNLPNNSELFNVRSNLTKALNEINKIEIKKENKNVMTPHQKWKLDLSTGSLQNMSLSNFNNAISALENMISKEEKKIKNKNGENNIDLIND